MVQVHNFDSGFDDIAPNKYTFFRKMAARRVHSYGDPDMMPDLEPRTL